MAADKTLTVKILADTEDAEKGIGNVEEKTGGLGQAFKNAAALAATFLAAKALDAVKDFVGSAITAYSNLEQATGGVEAVFGEFAEVIEEKSKDAAESVGLSEAAYKDLATNVGGLLKNLGFSTEEASLKTIDLINVGADLAATYGGEVSDAVAAITSLMRGERDPIEKFAISMKQTDINARVAALGLDTSTTSAQKNSEAIAALDILMGQAQDTTGQFRKEVDTHAVSQQILTAQLENQKAELGEALLPLQRTWMDLQSAAIPIIGELATEVARLTGAVSESETAIRRWEGEEGRAVETAEDLIDAIGQSALRGEFVFLDGEIVQTDKDMGKFTETMVEAIETGELDRKALNALEEALKDMGDRGELTKAQQDDLTAAIKAQHEELDLDEQAALEMSRMLNQRYRPAQNKAAAATERHVKAIDDQIAAHARAADPILNAITSARNLRFAQEAYHKVLRESDPASDEAIEAAQDVVEAQGNLDAALAKIVKETGPNWRAEFRRVAEQAGVADASIDAMIAAVERGDGMSAVVDVTARVTAPSFQYTQVGDVAKPTKLGTFVFDQGGIAPLGGVGDEAIVPLETAQGRRALAGALVEAMREIAGPTNGHNGDRVIELQVPVSRRQPLDGWAIVEALQTIERQSGPLPIRVKIGRAHV